ncbi:MAG: type II toxin-antitoxin system RelE/ParE family toxin [Beijerinckiaceae bacterium]
MTVWVVETLDERVDRELAALPLDMQAKFTRIGNLMAVNGPASVREPYVKHLEDKLWEMRMTGRDGISRAIYVTAVNRRIVVLRIFVKKSEKTPIAELQIARSRLREVL